MKLLKRVSIKPNHSKPKTFSLQELIEKRNKILIVRKWGGLGDIINTRPIFNNIKIYYPNLHITYALPNQYHCVVEDHPFIDKIIDLSKIDKNDYNYIADISSVCGTYEQSTAPYVDKHRSDIWAEHAIGITLRNHDFCFNLDSEFLIKCEEKLKSKYNPDTKIAIIPKSASASKDLTNEQVFELIKLIQNENLDPIVITNQSKFPEIDKQINDLNLKEFIYTMKCFDYVVSVDTGSFHLSCAYNIPTVGIFTWTDGYILSKYAKKVKIIQKHRDNENGFKCCPCWNWVNCSKKSGNKNLIPLPCMKEISPVEIKNGLLELINS